MEDLAENNLLAEAAALGTVAAVPAILEVLCLATGMGFAAVARVTEDRWIACCVRDEIGFGLKAGGELAVETTICHEIRENREPVIIDDVTVDMVYCGHPTPARYGFRSYVSFPIIRADGTFFGTLCAIHPKPARVRTQATIGMFKLFAELIAFHLDAIERLADSEARLSGERESSDLREQFIAVLGHDLRNPLAAISAGAELLAKAPMDARASRMVAVIRKGAARMSGLIDDVMDFARGRLGSGLNLERSSPGEIEPMLRQVVAELRAGSPDRLIIKDFRLTQAVSCDHRRISQLFSNLLGNALTHGSAAHPVRVSAISDDGWFELSVANGGEPIPAAALGRLFQPFARGAVKPNQQGLGLGLYISSEIARAHGGTLRADSSEQETRFTFRMPLDQG